MGILYALAFQNNLRLYINISIKRPIDKKTKKIQGVTAMQVKITIINIETHGSL
jgi:hypothetical protein